MCACLFFFRSSSIQADTTEVVAIFFLTLMLVRTLFWTFLLLLNCFPKYDIPPAVVLSLLNYKHYGHLVLQAYYKVVASK